MIRSCGGVLRPDTFGRVRLVLAAAGLLVLGLVGSRAYAVDADTVGINHSFGDSHSWHFDGTVSSQQHFCAELRRVRIFRKHDGPDVLIGATKTSTHSTQQGGEAVSEWVEEFGHLKRGRYYAKIKQNDSGCDPDTSHLVQVDY